MAFNLKEYILFRTEIKRELFNEEVDRNFQAVANPWTNYRRYEIGDVVYHPVIIESTTGEAPTTGEPEEFLVWWRANKRTTLGTFIMTQWDIIGGVGGFTNITIAGTDSFGNVLANWNAPIALPWDMAFNGDISANSAGDTLKITAGTGISIGWNQAELAFIINNTGAMGEVNNGVNIGNAPGAGSTGIDGPYAGMVGLDLSFYGLHARNDLGVSAGNALSAALDINDNLVYNLDQGEIDLGGLNSGCPTLDLLCDVTYISGTPSPGDLLQWSGSEWENIPISLIGSRNIYDNSDTIISPSRTVTLNAGAGRLYFGGNGAFAIPGFGLNNTGMGFTMGENATTTSRLLTLNANDALVSQLDLNNAGAGSASIHYEHPAGDYLAGMNRAAGSSSFTITGGNVFNGLNTDDFSVEGGNIWIPDWAPTGAATDNQHYIPFANDDGTNTGLTKTQAAALTMDPGLMWTYDGTDGTNSNAGCLYVNSVAMVGSSLRKSAIEFCNIPDESSTEHSFGLRGIVYPNPNPSTGSPNSASLFEGLTYAGTPPFPVDLSSGISLGLYDQLFARQYGIRATMIGTDDVDLSVGAGILHSAANASKQFGLAAIWSGSSIIDNAFGIFADVKDTYSGCHEITDTGIWAGFFRGCVNITEGGLVLGESATMPDCNIVTGDNIEERTLWINSADGHLYRGNVDVEAGSGVTMCAISDVDCTGLADGYILTYDAGSTDWVVGPNVSTLDSLCNLVDVDCITPGPQDGEILVYNGSTNMWENTTTGSLGLGNIYTQDGTITDALRTLTGNNNDLTFTGIKVWTTSANGSSHTTAGQMQLDAGTNLIVGAAANAEIGAYGGYLLLESQGLSATVDIASDKLITLTAITNVGISAGSDTTINTGTYFSVSATTNASIGTGSGGLISLSSGGDVDIQTDLAGAGNISLLTLGGSIGLDAQYNIILTANQGITFPNIISLITGPNVGTDYISIETAVWTQAVGGLGTITDGPPLMALNDGANDVTEYADWSLPKSGGSDGYILQYNTGITGTEWVNPADLSIVEICDAPIDCPTSMSDGDMLIYNQTNNTWDILPSPAGLTTLYTGDSALTGTRIVNLDAHRLVFDDIGGAGMMLEFRPGTSTIGFGNATTTGYTFPIIQGSVGQILALTAPNTVEWVDDSVFTLCDAPIECPTGGPSNGDGLVFNGSTGTWDIGTVGGYWAEGSCLIDILGNHTVIGGATTDNSIISGGFENSIDTSSLSGILGGTNNKVANCDNGSIVGGEDNEIDIGYIGGVISVSSIMGGAANRITNYGLGTIIGSGTCTIVGNALGGVSSGILVAQNSDILEESQNDVIMGGVDHEISGDGFARVVIGGSDNKFLPSTAVTGSSNEAGQECVILAGSENEMIGHTNRSGIIGGIDNTIEALQTGDGHVQGSSILFSNVSNITTLSGTGTPGINYSTILGGQQNDITAQNTGGLVEYCLLLGGRQSDIITNGATIQSSVIVGGEQNHLGIGTPGAATFENSAIIGGLGNQIYDGADESVIIGGNTNTIQGHERSVVLGGWGLTATAPDTVYVYHLNIGQLYNTFPVPTTIIAVDAAGNVCDGTSLLPSGGNQICGFDIDCPTGDPADGDTLVFNSGTGMWDVSEPCTGNGITYVSDGCIGLGRNISSSDPDAILTTRREVLLAGQSLAFVDNTAGTILRDAADLRLYGGEHLISFGVLNVGDIGSKVQFDGRGQGAATSTFEETTMLLSGERNTGLGVQNMYPITAHHIMYDPDQHDNPLGNTTDPNLPMNPILAETFILGEHRYDAYVLGNWNGAVAPLGNRGTSTLNDPATTDGNGPLVRSQAIGHFYNGTGSVGLPYGITAPSDSVWVGEWWLEGMAYEMDGTVAITGGVANLKGQNVKYSPLWDFPTGSAHSQIAVNTNYASWMIGTDDSEDLQTAMLDVVGKAGPEEDSVPFIRFRGMPTGGTDVVMIDDEDYLFKTTTASLLAGIGGEGGIEIGVELNQPTPYTDAAEVIVISPAPPGGGPGTLPWFGDDIIVIGTDGPGPLTPIDISKTIIIGQGGGKTIQGTKGTYIGGGVTPTAASTAILDSQLYIGGIGNDADPANIVIQADYSTESAVKFRINAGTADKGAVAGTMGPLDDINLEVLGTATYDVLNLKNEDGDPILKVVNDSKSLVIGDHSGASEGLHIKGRMNETPLLVTDDSDNAILTVTNNDNTVTIGATGSSYSLPSADGTGNEILTTDGAGVVTWVDPKTSDYWEHAFQTLIASNSFETSDTIPATGTDEALIGHDGSGWTGPNWDLVHDFTTPDVLLAENMNCGVPLPIDMAIGDSISIEGNFWGNNIAIGNTVDIFIYSYECSGGAASVTLSPVASGTSSVECTGNLNCFAMTFNLAAALDGGDCIVIGIGNYDNSTGGGNANAGVRMTYSLRANTSAPF